MREPRPRQRLPEGGLEIFEKQKAGMWRGAKLLMAYPTDWKSPRWDKVPTPEQIISTGYCMRINPNFDPMLYFWPVEEFQLITYTQQIDSDHANKIVRASLRDGAELVIVSTMTKLTSRSRWFDQANGWKKPAQEYEYSVRPPSKKTRYEMTLELIRQADREAAR